MEFSERIKDLRLSRDLTQVQMAKLCGYSERAYQKIEAGRGLPSYKGLVEIAVHFDISLDYLAGLTDDPKVHQLN